jgi:P27 family predicted phage terminase small subunit
MRGRKPKPTVLKLLSGNPGKRAINPDEPKPDALDNDLPEELTDKDAADEWNRTIVPAINIGQITESDRVLAIAHCELWATWRSQIAEAAKHAHVVAVGANKHPMPNPARTMSNKTLQLLTRVDAELGLTPVSRSRVRVGGPHSGDTEDRELARLLAVK